MWRIAFIFVLLFTACLPIVEPSTMSDSTGNLVISKMLILEEPVWDDLSIAMAQARTPASLAPTWRSYKQSQVPGFSATQVNVLYFSAQLPHTYKEGTNLEFHIHVAYPDALAGESTWYFSYSWANMGDAFPVPSEATRSLVSSPGVKDYHQFIEIEAVMPGTGKEISSVILCSIQRLGNDGDDDYPSEIYLISGDFHYQIDTMGSHSISSKWGDADD